MSELSRQFVCSLFLGLAWANLGLAQQDNHLVYQIFVRSFADTPSDTAPPLKGEVGDLKGIRENLDYLNDGDPRTDHDLEVGILTDSAEWMVFEKVSAQDRYLVLINTTG